MLSAVKTAGMLRQRRQILSDMSTSVSEIDSCESAIWASVRYLAAIMPGVNSIPVFPSILA